MDVIGNKSAHFRDCGDVSLLTFPHDGSQSDGFSQEWSLYHLLPRTLRNWFKLQVPETHPNKQD